jgi:hypothetical protein
MCSILDKLENSKVNYSKLTEEESNSTNTVDDFNYAWVIPIIVNDLNINKFNFAIERMQYIIDALLPDGRSLIIENWMVHKMGYLNQNLASRITEIESGFSEIFILFNFTPCITPKKWLNFIFWSAAQLKSICCDVDLAQCFLVRINEYSKWSRVSTLNINPHIRDIELISEGKYVVTYTSAREALQESSWNMSFTEIMQFLSRIRNMRWVHDKRPVQTTVNIDDKLLKDPKYYLADDRCHR